MAKEFSARFANAVAEERYDHIVIHKKLWEEQGFKYDDEFNGSRTLRKEVVLKQLRVKRPRNEQKRHLPRSGHLPRFSAEAEKETR
ncbi:hypothetical protein V6N13_064269 [Hibiscus sabdariffa]